MSIRELDIEGAWAFTPTIHGDDRGVFLEAFRGDELASAIGHRFEVAQMNVSVSQRGVLRGVHFADVPPSQAKYVTCQRGEVLDFIVDIRVGSPTFGQWTSVLLNDTTRTGVYISEGLGHAFLALTDDATVAYLVSTPYAAGREHGINPLDPALALTIPDGVELILSSKDQEAPSLQEALESGLLPTLTDVLAFRASRSAEASQSAQSAE